MDRESILLYEVSHGKTNTVLHFYVESTEQNKTEADS